MHWHTLSHAFPVLRTLHHAGVRWRVPPHAGVRWRLPPHAGAVLRCLLAASAFFASGDRGGTEPPRLVQVTVRHMPQDRWLELHEAAAARNMSIATFITRLLDVHQIAREYADGDNPTPGRVRMRAELERLGMGTVRR